MSTSDQDQDRRTGRGTGAPISEAPDVKPAGGANERAEGGPETARGSQAPETAEGGRAEEDAEDGEDGEDGDSGRRLTPRQARRLRIALSSAGMVVMGVVLALRIASRSSVLVVGVYGLALILCGLVIELSRNGRTRLGSWLLGAGLVAAVGADWLLLP